jgi:hypothetical protein
MVTALLLTFATLACCRGSLTRLGTFRSVFRARTATTIHPEGVKRPAHNVIANTGKVFHTPATHQHDGVLLEIVTFSGDVSDHFIAIGQANLGHFPEGGVGLLRGTGHNLYAHAAPEGALRERWALGLDLDLVPSFSDKLVDRWHEDALQRFSPWVQPGVSAGGHLDELELTQQLNEPEYPSASSLENWPLKRQRPETEAARAGNPRARRGGVYTGSETSEASGSLFFSTKNLVF